MCVQLLRCRYCSRSSIVRPQLRETIVCAQEPHPQARTETLIYGAADTLAVHTTAPEVGLIGYAEWRVV